MQTSTLCHHHEPKDMHCTGNDLVGCGLGAHTQPVIIYCEPAFLWTQCSRQLFCDLPRVAKLACLDSYIIEILIVVNSGILSLSTFSLLVSSYIISLATVWFKSSAAMAKAFSTLAAHITVVILFFGPCIFIYVWPFTTYPVDKVLAIFYTIFTPILNPIIYTLRNRDMKTAMRKIMTYYLRPKKISEMPLVLRNSL